MKPTLTIHQGGKAPTEYERILKTLQEVVENRAPLSKLMKELYPKTRDRVARYLHSDHVQTLR